VGQGGGGCGEDEGAAVHLCLFRELDSIAGGCGLCFLGDLRCG
jgi:hypothetical protein